MSQKLLKTSGWILTIVLAALFTMSAFMKLMLSEETVVQAASIGIEAHVYRLIGVVELVSLILFLVPRTIVPGALLLIAYMGGAIATHLQHQQPIAIAVVVEALVWIALALRHPAILQHLLPVSRIAEVKN